MGFGALFIGFMFLYDFQVVLKSSGMTLDIFPDLIGWILICIGLIRLTSHQKEFHNLKKSSFFFLLLSVFTLLKETLFASAFYLPSGEQVLAGTVVDFCLHLFELVFIFLFFRKLSVMCRRQKEDRLAFHHGVIPRLALTEGILYCISKIAFLFPSAMNVSSLFIIVSRLDFMFTVFLIWYGAILLLRCEFKLSDSVG